MYCLWSGLAVYALLLFLIGRFIATGMGSDDNG